MTRNFNHNKVLVLYLVHAEEHVAGLVAGLQGAEGFNEMLVVNKIILVNINLLSRLINIFDLLSEE
jgi:hypothetical protein